MAEYPGSENERRIPPADLKEAVTSIFAACGMDAKDAGLLAGALVNADQRGIHSHGTLRVPDYVHKLTKGGVDPAAVPRWRNRTLRRWSSMRGTRWARSRLTSQ